MAIVAGVDFGTLSVRVSIVDSERGLLASAIAEYPLHRGREDPDFATQSHEDHMRALAEATGQAVRSASISGDEVLSVALDTTGSSVIPVGKGLVPLDDYYLAAEADSDCAGMSNVPEGTLCEMQKWWSSSR
jgi:L-ribulokinase